MYCAGSAMSAYVVNLLYTVTNLSIAISLIIKHLIHITPVQMHFYADKYIMKTVVAFVKCTQCISPNIHQAFNVVIKYTTDSRQLYLLNYQ